MDATAGSRKYSLIRILLAAIIGLAVVALAAGQTQPDPPQPIYFDQRNDLTGGHAALGADVRRPRHMNFNSARRKTQSLDASRDRPSRDRPGHDRPGHDRPRIKRSPIWYDGLWQDRRMVGAIRTIT